MAAVWDNIGSKYNLILLPDKMEWSDLLFQLKQKLDKTMVFTYIVQWIPQIPEWSNKQAVPAYCLEIMFRPQYKEGEPRQGTGVSLSWEDRTGMLRQLDFSGRSTPEMRELHSERIRAHTWCFSNPQLSNKWLAHVYEEITPGWIEKLQKGAKRTIPVTPKQQNNSYSHHLVWETT